MTDIAEVRKALESIRTNSLHTKTGDCEPWCVKCQAEEALAALSRLERSAEEDERTRAQTLHALDELRSAAPEGKRWRHVNSGALVTEIGRGLYASGDGVDDITPIIFYRHDIGGWGSTFWARPIKEFEDGQFVEVTPIQTEEGKP